MVRTAFRSADIAGRSAPDVHAHRVEVVVKGGENGIEQRDGLIGIA
jgi:hypothetical protein